MKDLLIYYLHELCIDWNDPFFNLLLDENQTVNIYNIIIDTILANKSITMGIILILSSTKDKLDIIIDQVQSMHSILGGLWAFPWLAPIILMCPNIVLIFINNDLDVNQYVDIAILDNSQIIIFLKHNNIIWYPCNVFVTFLNSDAFLHTINALHLDILLQNDAIVDLQFGDNVDVIDQIFPILNYNYEYSICEIRTYECVYEYFNPGYVPSCSEYPGEL